MCTEEKDKMGKTKKRRKAKKAARFNLKRFKKHLPNLRLLHNSSAAVRRQMLKSAPASLIKVVAECCYNTKKGNVALPASHLEKLKRHKKEFKRIDTLLKKKSGVEPLRKHFVNQHGSFLPLLLSIIPGVLSAAAAVKSLAS